MYSEGAVLENQLNPPPGELTTPPMGHTITKTEFTYTEDDNVETVKYYDGDELLFTLTYLWNPDGTLNQVVRT